MPYQRRNNSCKSKSTRAQANVPISVGEVGTRFEYVFVLQSLGIRNVTTVQMHLKVEPSAALDRSLFRRETIARAEKNFAIKIKSSGNGNVHRLLP